MNKNLLELYADYLISSFGQTTATNLSRLLDNAISHDKYTQCMSKKSIKL